VTDAEKYVRRTWPHARIYTLGGPIHINSGPAYMSNTFNLGQDSTEIAAWADAANRIERQQTEKAGKP